MASERTARFITFATLGVLNVTQELAGAVLADVDGAEPDIVAEETLCLVATATARAAEVGLADDAEAAAIVSDTLLDLPFIYHDFLLGAEMIERQDSALAEAGEVVYGRLQRKREFYRAHLPAGRFPGEQALSDKMDLWMGRVSPPKLPETPSARLRRLNLQAPMLTHLRLILSYGKSGVNSARKDT